MHTKHVLTFFAKGSYVLLLCINLMARPPTPFHLIIYLPRLCLHISSTLENFAIPLFVRPVNAALPKASFLQFNELSETEGNDKKMI